MPPGVERSQQPLIGPLIRGLASQNTEINPSWVLALLQSTMPAVEVVVAYLCLGLATGKPAAGKVGKLWHQGLPRLLCMLHWPWVQAPALLPSPTPTVHARGPCSPAPPSLATCQAWRSPQGSQRLPHPRPSLQQQKRRGRPCPAPLQRPLQRCRRRRRRRHPPPPHHHRLQKSPPLLPRHPAPLLP